MLLFGHLAQVNYMLVTRSDGITVGVARRTRDFGVDTGGGSIRAMGVMGKRLCKAVNHSRRLAVIRRHTKKTTSLPEHQHVAMRPPPCNPLGSSVSKNGLFVIWKESDEYQRTRVRRGWRLSFEQLRDRSSRWLKVSGPHEAVMCVLLDTGWFPLHPTNWKQAGGEGFHWFFTGA